MSSAQDIAEHVDKDTITELIDKYESLDPYERKQKKERQVQNHYIEPLLEAIGWDTETDQVMPEQRTLTGSADYAISLHGEEQFFIEAKKFAKDLDGSRASGQSFVEQAIEYAWHQSCDWAVLTNFEEFRLYWTHVSKDSLEDGLVFELSYDEYTTEEGLEKLQKLSKPAVRNGSLTQLERTRERQSVTEEILNDLSNARIELTQDIHESHPDLDLDNVREGVQRILDRIVVMRVAEDRRIIPADNLLQRMETWEKTTINKENQPLWSDLKSAFRGFHSTYNSELFQDHDCEDWDISNRVLKDVINALYTYNFDYISADVLGSIYEDYLGHAISERGEDLELVAQQDTRREEGIYYTPIPVVEYLVDITVGERLESIMEDVRANLTGDDIDFDTAREEFDRIKEVTVLDVTCGSGSFLIKAFDRFVECYEEYKNLVDDAKEEGMDVLSFSGAQTIGNDYRTVILENNIYGVDMDPQAAEIASMNLLLKALRKEEELPQILNENIKTGNSLLNGSKEEVADVFEDGIDGRRERQAVDWESEFADVFEDQGGFTCIVGNPPWGAEIEGYREWIEHNDNYELATGQYDSYELSIELSEKLLQENGTLGFIIPDSVFREEHEELREWLTTEHRLDEVHKLGEGVFEDVWSGTAILQYTNTQSNGENTVRCSVLRKEDRDRMKGAGREALATLIDERLNTKRQRRILDEPDYNFRVFADEQDYEIMDNMEEDTVDTEEILFDSRGDEIGKSGNVMRCPSCMEWDTYPRSRAEDKGGGYYPKTCSHCGHKYEFENASQTRTIIKNHKPDDDWKKLYFGEHVSRYRESGQAFIDDSISGIDFEDESLYEPPKILLRKTGFGFNAFVDYTDARCLQVVFVFRLQEDLPTPLDNYDLEYFLGLLNSRVMLYYYTKERSEIEWQSYPYKTQGLVMGLPYPEIDWDDNEEVEKYERFVDLVRDACQSDGQINPEKDWEIERLAYDFYGISEDKRDRITHELHELQRLQVVRELFPDNGDE